MMMSSREGFLAGILSVGVIGTAMYFAPITPLEHLASKRFPTYSLDDTEGAIFITGCSSGIGRHAALSLAKEGYDVFATVRSKKDADSLKEEFQQQQQVNDNDIGDRLHPVICDVTDAKQIQRAKKSVQSWLQDEHSTSDKRRRVFLGIVNNAGVASEFDFLENTSVETLNHLWTVNIQGPLLVYQTFLPLIRSHGGRIVNVGSLCGQVGRSFRGPYTMTKFALEGMSDTQRQELLFENISVSMVNPGYIYTGVTIKTLADIDQDDPSQRSGMTSLQQAMLKAFQRSYINASKGTADESTAAIRHALLSQKPRTRYYPGALGVGMFPAWIFPKIKMLLSDRILDMMVAEK